MRYASTNFILKIDSGIYTEMENGIDLVKKFKITADEQTEILSQLKKFNVENIHTKKLRDLVYDKPTTSICFKISNTSGHCLSNSAMEDIKDKDYPNFSGVYAYLLSFAKNKTK